LNQLVLSQNGRESAVNRVLDGRTYPDQKLVTFSLCKKINSREMFGIGNAI
jgi:hypothetical protein